MRQQEDLHLYGNRSDRPSLAWAWVEEQLAGAGTYWVVACTQAHRHPHPRPVWGVWHGDRLHLSLGSPTLRRALRTEPVVTVHLDSGTDVVIVEGLAIAGVSTTAELNQAYDQKYAWTYDASRYGDLIVVEPRRVMAWRTTGWAGRDSFQSTGCWSFDGWGQQ